MSTDEESDPPSFSPDYEFLTVELRARGATGFVAVGDRFDDTLRYLSRFEGPDRSYAFVCADQETVLCAPTLFDAQAAREFPGDDVRTGQQGSPAGVRAAAVLEGMGHQDGHILVPPDIPHDAAVHLEDAGYDLASTTAVAEARMTKTTAELARLRRTQRAATIGMVRAETILSEARPHGNQVRWNGTPLTTDRLRREVNAVLSSQGVRDAGNTVIGAGETATDLHFTGNDPIFAGETVLLDLSPRGPDGYYGDLTRTYTIRGEGGWDRRAYLAVKAARKAALAELQAGVSAVKVHTEAAAEIAAHGFRTDSRTVGFTHSTGHGVGISLHERPTLSADTELKAGTVITVEPGVYNPDEGGVRLEDLVLVTDEGYELLAEYPFGLSPTSRGEGVTEAS